MFFGILQRALLKELLATFLAVLVVLLLITFGSEVTRVLAKAVRGDIPADLVMDLMIFKLVRAQDVVLPLVALIAVMLTFGRMHQDQEIVVMQTGGIGLGFFRKTVVLFLIPLTLLLYWVMLFVFPWSYQNERTLINDALSKNSYVNIEAATFNELVNNQGVIYAQEVSNDGRMSQVWVSLKTSENDLILTAREGQFIRNADEVILSLKNGWRYSNLRVMTSDELASNRKPLEVQKFEHFEGILPKTVASYRYAKIDEKPIEELWLYQTSRERALLHSRLSIPLSILVLGLIGLRLSKTGPRQGRFAKLFIALLIFIIYNQLVLSADDIAKEGGSPVWFWLIPSVFMLWALGWDQKFARIWKRNSIQSKKQRGSSCPKDQFGNPL